MQINQLKIWFVFIQIGFLIAQLNAQATLTGTITVDSNGKQIFIWDGSDSVERPFSVKISLTYKSIFIASALTTPVDVSITCTANLLKFQAKTFSVSSPTTAAIIPFTISDYGSTIISCSGTVGSFPTPQTIGTVQFTSMTISNLDASSVDILPSPKIYFDSNQIDVSPDSTASNSFRIKFRDTVVDSPVVLTCTPGTATGSTLLVLKTIASVTVAIGQNEVYVPFNVQTLGLSSIQVTCTANSQNSVQYKNTAATAAFKLIEPRILIKSDASDENLYGTSFQFDLQVQPTAQNSEVQVECAIREFDTLTAWNQFKTNTNCPSSLKTTNGQTSSAFVYGTYDNSPYHWYIIDSTGATAISTTFTFSATKGIQYVSVTKYPSNLLKTDTTSYLALYCCDITTSTALLYQSTFKNRYSSISFKATVEATLAASNVTFTEPLKMRSFLSPAYEQIGTCNCDLTPDICDINCCCDKLCTKDDIIAFEKCDNNPTAIPIDAIANYWNCSNSNLQKEDYFPILCFQFSTSAILGKYYLPANAKAVQSLSEFTSTYGNAFSSTYSSAADDTFLASKTTSSICYTESNYKNGTCIKTLYYENNDMSNSNKYVSNIGVLTFPASFANRQCVSDTPVRFLIDQDKTFCEWTLSQTACTTQAAFNANSYILSTFLIKNLKTVQPQVLQSPTIDSNTVQTYVEYYRCAYNSFADDSALNVQLQSTAKDASDNCECQQEPANLIFDKTSTNSCGATTPDQFTNIPNVKKDYTSNGLTGCVQVSFTDSLPSSPTYNTVTKQCTNMVTRVKYVLLWNGQNIVRILVRVVISDVTTANKNTLKQSVELKWHKYVPSKMSAFTTVSQFENYLSSNDYIQNQLSGSSGYFRRKPIVSGKLVNNKIDTAYNNRISAFLSNADNLCGVNSLRKLVNFGENSTSTCQIKINSAGFKCSCLKQILYNRLNSYFAPSDYVSKNGNVSDFDSSNKNWIKIRRENLTEPQDDSLNDVNTCYSVPTGITVWFMYIEAGKSESLPINEIVAVYVSYTYSTVQFRCQKDTADCVNFYQIESNTKFIDLTKRNNTVMSACNYTSDSCIEDLFWLWRNNYEGEDLYYAYTANLCMLFGFLSVFTVHFLLFGLTCPC